MSSMSRRLAISSLTVRAASFVIDGCWKGRSGRRMVPSARFVRLRRVSRFHGRFALAGDKSISHRLAILGALAHGRTAIGNFSAAADCQSTLDCLARMGVAVTRGGPDVTIDG